MSETMTFVPAVFAYGAQAFVPVGDSSEISFDRSTPERRAARFEVEAVPHLPVLKRFALHLTRNASDAEDLVQETYAQALQSFDRYETGTNCRAWLCKIMFHKRSQQIRARARFLQFDEGGELNIPAFVAENSLLPPEFVSEKLSLAVGDLPVKFQTIVWLAVVEDYTYSEIADTLHIPIGTVMSRLHRGRKLLRAKFTERAACASL